MSEEEEEKVIELDYLETPKGPVARFQGVKQLAELLVEVVQEIEQINQKLQSFQTKTEAPGDVVKRLEEIEKQLEVMNDDIREILNALGELSATVSQIKKALKL